MRIGAVPAFGACFLSASPPQPRCARASDALIGVVAGGGRRRERALAVAARRVPGVVRAPPRSLFASAQRDQAAAGESVEDRGGDYTIRTRRARPSFRARAPSLPVLAFAEAPEAPTDGSMLTGSVCVNLHPVPVFGRYAWLLNVHSVREPRDAPPVCIDVHDATGELRLHYNDECDAASARQQWAVYPFAGAVASNFNVARARAALEAKIDAAEDIALAAPRDGRQQWLPSYRVVTYDRPGVWAGARMNELWIPVVKTVLRDDDGDGGDDGDDSNKEHESVDPFADIWCRTATDDADEEAQRVSASGAYEIRTFTVPRSRTASSSSPPDAPRLEWFNLPLWPIPVFGRYAAFVCVHRQQPAQRQRNDRDAMAPPPPPLALDRMPRGDLRLRFLRHTTSNADDAVPRDQRRRRRRRRHRFAVRKFTGTLDNGRVNAQYDALLRALDEDGVAVGDACCGTTANGRYPRRCFRIVADNTPRVRGVGLWDSGGKRRACELWVPLSPDEDGGDENGD